MSKQSKTLEKILRIHTYKFLEASSHHAIKGIEFEFINAVLIYDTGEELLVDKIMATFIIGSNITSSVEAIWNNRK